MEARIGACLREKYKSDPRLTTRVLTYRIIRREVQQHLDEALDSKDARVILKAKIKEILNLEPIRNPESTLESVPPTTAEPTAEPTAKPTAGPTAKTPLKPTIKRTANTALKKVIKKPAYPTMATFELCEDL